MFMFTLTLHLICANLFYDHKMALFYCLSIILAPKTQLVEMNEIILVIRFS